MGKIILKKRRVYLFSREGICSITEKGKNHSSSLTVRDLEDENSFFNFYNQEKGISSDKNKSEINISSPQDLIDEGFSRIEKDVKADLLLKSLKFGSYF